MSAGEDGIFEILWSAAGEVIFENYPQQKSGLQELAGEISVLVDKPSPPKITCLIGCPVSGFLVKGASFMWCLISKN